MGQGHPPASGRASPLRLIATAGQPCDAPGTALAEARCARPQGGPTGLIPPRVPRAKGAAPEGGAPRHAGGFQNGQRRGQGAAQGRRIRRGRASRGRALGRTRVRAREGLVAAGRRGGDPAPDALAVAGSIPLHQFGAAEVGLGVAAAEGAEGPQETKKGKFENEATRGDLRDVGEGISWTTKAGATAHRSPAARGRPPRNARGQGRLVKLPRGQAAEARERFRASAGADEGSMATGRGDRESPPAIAEACRRLRDLGGTGEVG